MIKKLLYLLILIPFYLCSNELKKPVLKAGIKSKNAYDQLENKNIYPDLYYDLLYLSLEQQFNQHFTYKHKISFVYCQYEKYQTELDNLHYWYLKNDLQFCISINKNHKLTCQIVPNYHYKYQEHYYQQAHSLKYQISFKYFHQNLLYKQRLQLNDSEYFNHYFKYQVYWQIPKFQLMKYKTTLCVLLQHGIEEELDKPLLKQIHLQLEVIIDFNKIDLKNFIDKATDLEEDRAEYIVE
ncbi:MAG: hypothetical protein MJB14_15125 [Spirochaetes bacterium]|nr:hypothetical protein [Spirochaetota bacterium]